jgi:hypothetical protein
LQSKRDRHLNEAYSIRGQLHAYFGDMKGGDEDMLVLLSVGSYDLEVSMRPPSCYTAPLKDCC